MLSGNSPRRIDREDGKKDPQFAYTLAKGFQILESFAEGKPVLGNRDFCLSTGMEKSTVWRLTRTLTELGYLRQDPGTGKFSLGLALASLAYPLLINLPIRRIAHPLMQQLAEATQGAVNLGMRDRFDLVFVESCRETENIGARPEIGARRPLTGVLGEIYLAGLPKNARDELLQDMRRAGVAGAGLARSIETRVAEMARKGYCFLSRNGIHMVAGTFRAAHNGEACLLNCVVEERLVPREKMLTEVANQFLAMLRRLEKTLGTAGMAILEPA